MKRVLTMLMFSTYILAVTVNAISTTGKTREGYQIKDNVSEKALVILDGVSESSATHFSTIATDGNPGNPGPHSSILS